MPLIELDADENTKRANAFKRILPKMEPDDNNWCDQDRNGWECTRKTGHKGACVAHLAGGEPVAAWGETKSLLKLMGRVHDA